VNGRLSDPTVPWGSTQRTIVVTGGASGISQRLAADCAAVAIFGRNEAEAASVSLRPPRAEALGPLPQTKIKLSAD
jgi:NAD(P)-dependent dehydrogenase (short-subunit alcohol dehydrogenase family)